MAARWFRGERYRFTLRWYLRFGFSPTVQVWSVGHSIAHLYERELNGCPSQPVGPVIHWQLVQPTSRLLDDLQYYGDSVSDLVVSGNVVAS